jgi:hypothetical protein
LTSFRQTSKISTPTPKPIRSRGKLPPFVTRCLTLPCTKTQRAALRCVLNLARCPALRTQLGLALPRLLELLEVEELRGAAAGALCNVACEATAPCLKSFREAHKNFRMLMFSCFFLFFLGMGRGFLMFDEEDVLWVSQFFWFGQVTSRKASLIFGVSQGTSKGPSGRASVALSVAKRGE